MNNDEFAKVKAIKACLQSLHIDALDAELALAAHLIQVTIEELDDTINNESDKRMFVNSGYNRIGLPH
jgi:hypothetical protein